MGAIYLPSLIGFQALYMEWPFFDAGVCSLLAGGVSSVLAPTALEGLGLWKRWRCRGLLWALEVWLGWQAYAYTVRGPLPPSQDWQLQSLQGRVCIITGSSTGLGCATAEAFAAAGGTVIFACRSEARAQAAMRQVATSLKPASVADRLHFLELDVASFSSVRRFVSNFKEQGWEPHILVLNAGVIKRRRELSEDGIEMTLATNLFGHFLLVQLLLPQLLEAEARGAQPRIIAVGSTMWYNYEVFDLREAVAVLSDDDRAEFWDRPYDMFQAYGQSKLGCMLLINELAQRLKRRGSNIPANVVHPGICMTEVQRDMHPVLVFLMWLLHPLLRLYFKSAHLGALNVVWAASAPCLATSSSKNGASSSGEFLMRLRPTRPATASNEPAARQLWEAAVELTGAGAEC